MQFLNDIDVNQGAEIDLYDTSSNMAGVVTYTGVIDENPFHHHDGTNFRADNDLICTF